MKGQIKNGFIVFVTIIFTMCFLYSAQVVQLQAAGKGNIEWLIEQGFLTEPFSAEKIISAPNSRITVQEFVTLIMRVLGENGTEEEFRNLPYPDRWSAGKPYRTYLAAADKFGLIYEKGEGKNKNKMLPTWRLTKESAAYTLGKALGLFYTMPMDWFNDYLSIPDTARHYAAGLVYSGLMNGTSNVLFKPHAKLTWEEAAGLIRKAYEDGYFQTKEIVPVINTDQADKEKMVTNLNGVSGITMDEDGKIYITDTRNQQIKFIKDGECDLLAGKEQPVRPDGWRRAGYVDGSFALTEFNQPMGIRSVKDALLVADTGNHVIRIMENHTQTTYTYAGTGVAGYRDGERKNALFNSPQGIDIVADGTIYIADTGNSCIRMIYPDGQVATTAGKAGESGYLDGPVSEALFCYPTGILTDGNCIYIADTGNQRIRKIENGMVSTIAGTSIGLEEDSEFYIGGYRDGLAAEAMFCQPTNLTTDGKGTLYISDTGNGMIRKIKDGVVSTIAGFGSLITASDEEWSRTLQSPAGLFISKKNGRLYVVDSFYNNILSLEIDANDAP